MNYAITAGTANFTISKYGFSSCAVNGQCTGGSKANSNGVGGLVTISSSSLAAGSTLTAAITLAPAAVGGKDALTSPGVDSNNQPLPPVFTLWLAPAADPTHPVVFGTGTAIKTGPDANGNSAWSTTITAPLDPSIVPGNYTAYVFGDDGSSLTNNQVPSDAGYGLADTVDFSYPTVSAPFTVTALSTTTSVTASGVTYKDDAIVTVTVASTPALPRAASH